MKFVNFWYARSTTENLMKFVNFW